MSFTVCQHEAWLGVTIDTTSPLLNVAYCQVPNVLDCITSSLGSLSSVYHQYDLH